MDTQEISLWIGRTGLLMGSVSLGMITGIGLRMLYNRLQRARAANGEVEQGSRPEYPDKNW